jgi:hypothetical protein
MDLTIESFNFCVGSLGSIRLADPINSGPSAEKNSNRGNLRNFRGLMQQGKLAG